MFEEGVLPEPSISQRKEPVVPEGFDDQLLVEIVELVVVECDSKSSVHGATTVGSAAVVNDVDVQP